MKPGILPTFHRFAASAQLALIVALLVACFSPPLEVQAAASVSDKVNAVAAGAEQQIADTAKAAESKLQELWRRIDEQRLKNRTPDQLVAWVIMGLLAGALVYRLSKLSRAVTLLVGLAGAFLGGVIANVTQLDLGMGPVLIRYEDLVFSLLGGLIIVFVARWLASRRAQKAQSK
jgi:uncharacterized membrane protein YeaQ/YmgE (transglycosylase-associated protein family)